MLATAVTWITNGSALKVNVKAPSIVTRFAIVMWPSRSRRIPLWIVTVPVFKRAVRVRREQAALSPVQASPSSPLVMNVTVCGVRAS